MLAGQQLLLIIAAALLGAIVGSFLNALSFRFNTGRNVFKSMSGRSRCMSCNHTLGVLDLVPVFSFLLLGAKCRYCHSQVSWQYPLVELIAAFLAVLVFIQNPSPLGFAFWLLVWMTLLFIAVYDIKHTIIPWSCSILLAVLALISLFMHFPMFDLVGPTAWALLAGPILAAPLFLISLISRGRWMGWGDSGLELSLGWLLGLFAGLSALMMAFWSGALVGLAMLLYQRIARSGKKTRGTIGMQSEIPFAPFLILGAALAYFLHVDFFSSISLF